MTEEIQKALERPDLDTRLVYAVVNATMIVMETMAHTSVDFKEMKTGEYYHPKGDISAIIGIFGIDGTAGMLAISFPAQFAKLTVQRLLGLPPEGTGISLEDVCDGIRELVNMISGRAKSTLTQGTETHYNLSLPAIILGREHLIFNRPNIDTHLLIKFTTDEGESFSLQVSFKTQE